MTSVVVVWQSTVDVVGLIFSWAIFAKGRSQLPVMTNSVTFVKAGKFKSFSWELSAILRSEDEEVEE